MVDRKDLDYQTIREFNSFSKGSVDATNHTNKLVQQFDDDTRLIVTTLQKLNTAINKDRYAKTMTPLQDRRMVFIFDECHRSQFGETHKRIKKFFPLVQMFGFTGTPIFAENASTNEYGRRTTKDLFDRCLHKYVITDAIHDESVLKFSVEYIRTVKQKEGVKDIEVEAIDKAEVMEANERLDAITDYIISNHSRKTHDRVFNAIFCVSNIKTLIRYFELLQKKKTAGEHSLKIATIFSWQVNEDDSDANGFIETDVTEATYEEVNQHSRDRSEGLVEDYRSYISTDNFYDYYQDIGKHLNERQVETETDVTEVATGEVNQHSRDKLEGFIKDYNDTFGTNFSTDNFYGYYKDIGKRTKERQVDILLVVNMFLTGFDSKYLNTIYVDKNLKYHGLVQAYSRTNRTLGQKKSQGNVVCFRNLKPATDQAIELFANKDAIEEIILQPYEKYVEWFADAVAALQKIVPTVNSVNELPDEEEEARFIQAFRELMRIKNVLSCFTEFSFDDLDMDEQSFEDYKSKYLDLYDKVRTDRQKEKVSILEDIDFELELIHRDEINVSYIITLLRNMKSVKPAEQENQRRVISRYLETETQLRSKKELIERFIAEHFPVIPQECDVGAAFEKYWTEEKRKAIQLLSEDEDLDTEGLQKVIGDYLYTEKSPLRDDVIAIMHTRPRLKQRRTITERIIEKIKAFVETFIDGVD